MVATAFRPNRPFLALSLTPPNEDDDDLIVASSLSLSQPLVTEVVPFASPLPRLLPSEPSGDVDDNQGSAGLGIIMDWNVSLL